MRVGLVAAGATPASAQEVSAEYQGVLKTLGKGGDYKEGVLKVNAQAGRFMQQLCDQ